jgi:hypothetical protein
MKPALRTQFKDGLDFDAGKLCLVLITTIAESLAAFCRSADAELVWRTVPLARHLIGPPSFGKNRLGSTDSRGWIEGKLPERVF